MRSALGLLLVLAGCVQRMDDQPRYAPYAPARLFADGGAMQPPPAGTVARDDRREPPPAVTPALLALGRTRFGIHCAPCHGLAGDGDGVVVQHGFPAPPSLHHPRLVAAPEGHLYAVITDGYGVMYPYGGRVLPAERWAIIAYVRALQLSRRGTLADVPAARRAELEGGGS
jgi:mono/diheme cytochrome c family protein